MSRFEFQDKIFNLSLDLGDRLNLAFFEKIWPNLIPSKVKPFGWVDLNYKIKFAICHWTWEIG